MEAEKIAKGLRSSMTPRAVRYKAWVEVTNAVARLVRLWLSPGEPGPGLEDLDKIGEVLNRLGKVRSTAMDARLRSRRDPLEARGVPKAVAQRIALLTPYVDEINQSMRSYIEARDIAVPVMGSYNHGNDLEVARISAQSVRDAALELGREPGVDAVFVACTSIRLAKDVEALEAELSKPVTSSNHALAWHCLRLAGYDEPVPGFGRLMRTPL